LTATSDDADGSEPWRLGSEGRRFVVGVAARNFLVGVGVFFLSDFGGVVVMDAADRI
jgi:hypothetical protein